MKKYLLVVLAIVGLGVGLSWAETDAGIPQGPEQALASGDYYGVEYSTSNFSTAFTTVGVGEFSVYGVTFSSGNTNDFVQIYDTGSWAQAGTGGTSTETIRVFNVSNSSGGVNNSSSYSASGYVPVGPRPVRFKRGLGWRSSSSGYTSIILHYYRRRTRVNGDP